MAGIMTKARTRNTRLNHDLQPEENGEPPSNKTAMTGCPPTHHSTLLKKSGVMSDVNNRVVNNISIGVTYAKIIHIQATSPKDQHSAVL
jgi:hypothetical protein